MGTPFDIVTVAPICIDEVVKRDGNSIFTFGCSKINTIVALQRLGLKTSVVTVVGEDENSTEFISDLHDEGVDALTFTDPSYIAPVNRIESVLDKDPVVIRMQEYKRPEQITPEIESYLVKSKALFIGAFNPQAIDYIRFAAENDIDVYLSLHLSKDLSPQFIKYLPSIKAIIGNREEEEQIQPYFSDIDLSKTRIFITLDKDGSKEYNSEGVRTFNPIKIEFVDPLGAGDAFSAGVVYSLITGFHDPSILGNIMGGLATTQYGSRVKKINMDDVNHFLD